MREIDVLEPWPEVAAMCVRNAQPLACRSVVMAWDVFLLEVKALGTLAVILGTWWLCRNIWRGPPYE